MLIHTNAFELDDDMLQIATSTRMCVLNTYVSPIVHLFQAQHHILLDILKAFMLPWISINDVVIEPDLF